jgi:hypothetical protein
MPTRLDLLLAPTWAAARTSMTAVLDARDSLHHPPHDDGDLCCCDASAGWSWRRRVAAFFWEQIRGGWLYLGPARKVGKLIHSMRS